MKYEKYIEDLENGEPLNQETIEAASEAMAFVLALHNMFQDNGVGLDTEPDCSTLENLIDGLNGELAAACLFLSERSFARVPDMLREVALSFDRLDKVFVDDSGYNGPSVPTVIRKGFTRLADRIEATRQQQSQMISAAKSSV